MTTADARSTTAVDYVMGRKLRSYRNEAGLSQQALAERLNITFQQVQKYEKGMNRLAASRLVSVVGVFAKALDREPQAIALDFLELTPASVAYRVRAAAKAPAKIAAKPAAKARKKPAKRPRK